MSYHTNRAVELDSLYLGVKTDHGRLQRKYYGGSLDICYTGDNDLFSVDIDNENGTYVTGFIDTEAAWSLYTSLESQLESIQSEASDD